MNDKAIEHLSGQLTEYILQLKRAPTRVELVKFIKEFIRDRKNGKLTA